MTREEAKKEIEKVFEPAFANYIIKALTDGATESDAEPQGFEEYLKQYLGENDLKIIGNDVWEEMKAKAEQAEWVSVKDGLPKEKGMYKITLQTDSGYRYVAEDYFFTERNFFESEAYYRGVGRKIIAWQPITVPSPYKGEE